MAQLTRLPAGWPVPNRDSFRLATGEGQPPCAPVPFRRASRTNPTGRAGLRRP